MIIENNYNIRYNHNSEEVRLWIHYFYLDQEQQSIIRN